MIPYGIQLFLLALSATTAAACLYGGWILGRLSYLLMGAGILFIIVIVLTIKLKRRST